VALIAVSRARYATVQSLRRLDEVTEERDALARCVAELTAAEEPGRLRPTVVPGDEPPPAAATSRHRIATRPRESGSARLWAVALVVLVGLALAACPRVIREPAVPAPAPGCDGGATACNLGAPFRCGPGGQWSQADRACGRLTSDAGAVVCCATPSAIRPGVLVHACVPSNLCVEAP
jgi:hypothetical protein